LFARDVVRKSEEKDAKIVPERRGCGLEMWVVCQRCGAEIGRERCENCARKAGMRARKVGSA